MVYGPCGCLRPQPPRTLAHPVRGARPIGVRHLNRMAAAGHAQRVHSQQESWMTSCFRCLPAPNQRTVLEIRLPYTEATAPEATTSASETLDHILRTHRTHKA
jgi:hypothetical protein